MTPAILKLSDEIKADPGLTLGSFLTWLQWVQTRDEGAPTFKRADSCECPVATFLRERYHVESIYEWEGATEPVSIEVGDDDISVEGNYVMEIPLDLLTFVRMFDVHFKDRHYNDRISVAEAFGVYRKGWQS